MASKGTIHAGGLPSEVPSTSNRFLIGPKIRSYVRSVCGAKQGGGESAGIVCCVRVVDFLLVLRTGATLQGEASAEGGGI